MATEPRTLYSLDSLFLWFRRYHTHTRDGGEPVTIKYAGQHWRIHRDFIHLVFSQVQARRQRFVHWSIQRDLTMMVTVCREIGAVQNLRSRQLQGLEKPMESFADFLGFVTTTSVLLLQEEHAAARLRMRGQKWRHGY